MSPQDHSSENSTHNSASADELLPKGRSGVRAVIFDVDGTLIDSNEAHVSAWIEVFQRFGHNFERAAIRAQMGKGGDQLMPVFLSEERIKAVGEEIETQRKQIFTENYLPNLSAFPQVRDLIQRVLADGRQVVLASSASKEELSKYKKIARIEDLVEQATSKDDVENSKPHPDIFRAALDQLDGLEAKDVLVVGDSPYDAQAASKIGIRTVGVLSGGFTEVTLRDAGCVAIYKDPADLLEQYGSSPLIR